MMHENPKRKREDILTQKKKQPPRPRYWAVIPLMVIALVVIYGVYLVANWHTGTGRDSGIISMSINPNHSAAVLASQFHVPPPTRAYNIETVTSRRYGWQGWARMVLPPDAMALFVQAHTCFNGRLDPGARVVTTDAPSEWWQPYVQEDFLGGSCSANGFAYDLVAVQRPDSIWMLYLYATEN